MNCSDLYYIAMKLVRLCVRTSGVLQLEWQRYLCFTRMMRLNQNFHSTGDATRTPYEVWMLVGTLRETEQSGYAPKSGLEIKDIRSRAKNGALKRTQSRRWDGGHNEMEKESQILQLMTTAIVFSLRLFLHKSEDKRL